MSECKRVKCLYRVSIKGQVEKDDIPMQREFCREFVSRQPGWKIEQEYYEKGVSGFKTSAKDRDAIQELQRAAIKKEFDILLVFMFDRLGRRDDETPFVVEWFVANGIEVWSAVEGQQRFDNHVDKLLNYIRYWQASGESIKTSVRVKTRMEQMTEKGLYTGGTVPYGYKLEKRGRQNKKNQDLNDLVVDEDAAKIVQLIFYKYVHEGFGAQRLSRYLTEMGIRKSNGKNFPNTSLIRMLKNRVYTGVLCNGEATSGFIPELQIIDQETFDRAQELMKGRTTHHADTPLNLRGQSLLVGNIYCGHCKNRLTLTTSGRRRIRADGSIHNEVRSRYQCHYKVRHPDECDGQSGYGVTKLDGIMDKIIRYQFSKISASAENEVVAEQHKKAIELAKARHKLTCMQLSEKQRELEDYRAETIKVIRGESKLSIDLLNSLIAESETAIQELTATAEAAKAELDKRISDSKEEQAEYEKLRSWADLYDNCTFAAKKMIVSQFIKAVYVYRDYMLEIEFNVSFDQFKHLGAECEENRKEGDIIHLTA